MRRYICLILLLVVPGSPGRAGTAMAPLAMADMPLGTAAAGESRYAGAVARTVRAD
ncbi:MAG: hypothetical protein J0M19_02180 [Sphingomonadales bacterium]|nr:hypothetical protein [Sphingomonadales bacterium]